MEDYREQVFLRRKDKQPLYVQASRHEPNPEQVRAAGIRAQCEGGGNRHRGESPNPKAAKE